MAIETFVILSTAIFAGAFVTGLAGFAGSSVAGAFLLRTMPPLEAIPLMMMCSILIQAAALYTLRHHIAWKDSLLFIAGGLVGVPIAVWLLQNADAVTFPRRLRTVCLALCRVYVASAEPDLFRAHES